MRVNIGRLEGNGHAYMVKYRMFPVLCWVVVNSVNETKARGHSFFFFFLPTAIRVVNNNNE